MNSLIAVLVGAVVSMAVVLAFTVRAVMEITDRLDKGANDG